MSAKIPAPLNRDEAQKLFEKYNWSVPAVKKALNKMSFPVKHRFVFDVFEEAGVLDVFKEKFNEKTREYTHNRVKLGQFFSLGRPLLAECMRDPRLSYRLTKLTDEEVQRLFEKHNWNVFAMRKELNSRNSRVENLFLLDVFDNAGALTVFKKKFNEKAKEYMHDRARLRQFFGMGTTLLADCMRDPRLSYRRPELTNEQTKKLFEKYDWKVPFVRNKLKAMGFRSKNLTALDIFENAGMLEVLREKFAQKAKRYRRNSNKLSKFFSVNRSRMTAWLRDPRLSYEMPKLTDEQGRRLFAENSWSIPVAKDKLCQMGYGTVNLAYLDIFERAGCLGVFKEKLNEKIKECWKSAYKLERFFNVDATSVYVFFKDSRIRPSHKPAAEDISAAFTKNKWKLKAVAGELLVLGVRKKKGDDLIAIFRRAKAMQLFREKLTEKDREYGGSVQKLAGFFGLNKREMVSLLNDPRAGLDGRQISQKTLIGIFERNKWNAKRAAAELSLKGVVGQRSEGPLDIFEKAGAFEIFKEGFLKKVKEFKGDTHKLSKFFGVASNTIIYWWEHYDLYPASVRLNRREAIKIFEKNKWKVDRVVEELAGLGAAVWNKAYLDVFENTGLLAVFKARLQQARREYNGSSKKIAKFFGVRDVTIRKWVVDPRILPDGKAPARETILAVIEKYNWDLDKAVPALAEYGLGDSALSSITYLGYKDMLYDKLLSVYREVNYNNFEFVKRFHPAMFSGSREHNISAKSLDYFMS
ncbi:MAG: hypothetical protein NTV07_06945, partial [Candidatus Omnitrophica bacterium]|nr:hypothetical protein [Candidatus Omnitrophota bacterium]